MNKAQILALAPRANHRLLQASDTGEILVVMANQPGADAVVLSGTGEALLPSDVVNNLTAGGTAVPLSAEQGKTLKGYIDTINTLLTSDNFSLDSLQEVVDEIESIQSGLTSLAIANITGLQAALDERTPLALEAPPLSHEDDRLPLIVSGTLLDSGGAPIATPVEIPWVSENHWYVDLNGDGAFIEAGIGWDSADDPYINYYAGGLGDYTATGADGESFGTATWVVDAGTGVPVVTIGTATLALPGITAAENGNTWVNTGTYAEPVWELLAKSADVATATQGAKADAAAPASIFDPVPALDEAAMLALDVPVGSIVHRTDQPGKEYKLYAQPASTLTNWKWKAIGAGDEDFIAVEMELADFTGTVPDANLLGQVGGVPSIGDGATSGGKKVFMDDDLSDARIMSKAGKQLIASLRLVRGTNAGTVYFSTTRVGPSGSEIFSIYTTTGYARLINPDNTLGVQVGDGNPSTLLEFTLPASGHHRAYGVMSVASGGSVRSGDITWIAIKGMRLTAFSLEGFSTLTDLILENNLLTELDVDGVALPYDYSYTNGSNLDYNLFSAAALNEFFESLGVDVTASGYIRVADNPGSSTCDPSIATAKGYTIVTS